MARREGWEKILADYLTDQETKPFVWGENDCMLFAARGAKAILKDRDVETEILGYGVYDKARALEIVKNHGDICAILDKHLKRKTPALANRGDIAVVKQGNYKAAGIVTGRYVACKTLSRLVFVPLREAVAVWEVE